MVALVSVGLNHSWCAALQIVFEVLVVLELENGLVFFFNSLSLLLMHLDKDAHCDRPLKYRTFEGVTRLGVLPESIEDIWNLSCC